MFDIKDDGVAAYAFDGLGVGGADANNRALLVSVMLPVPLLLPMVKVVVSGELVNAVCQRRIADGKVRDACRNADAAGGCIVSDAIAKGDGITVVVIAISGAAWA